MRQSVVKKFQGDTLLESCVSKIFEGERRSTRVIVARALGVEGAYVRELLRCLGHGRSLSLRHLWRSSHVDSDISGILDPLPRPGQIGYVLPRDLSLIATATSTREFDLLRGHMLCSAAALI